MTPAQALLLMQCRADVPDQQCYEAMAVLTEAVECARVVGVLDALADKLTAKYGAYASGIEPHAVALSNGRFAMVWWGSAEFYVGDHPTRDAARAAAAKAIEAGELV